MKNYKLVLKNANDVNLSNWQISHIVNTLTTVNNKFDVLTKLNKKFK